MDAMAVAICQGMAISERSICKSLAIAGSFGLFQALMPTIGYFIGSKISPLLLSYNKILAFLLLLVIGGKMLYEAFKHKDSCDRHSSDFNPVALLTLSVATSIDALAVGISLAMLRVDIISSVLTIGSITFVLSLAGVMLGMRFKNAFKSKSEIIGGVTLILIGLKILFT